MTQEQMIAEASSQLARALGVPVSSIYTVSFQRSEPLAPLGPHQVRTTELRPIAVIELGLARRLFVVRVYPAGNSVRCQWSERRH